MRFARRTAALASFCSLAATASAQTFIACPNSTDDVIYLLDPTDGSVVDATFIEDDPTGTLYDFNLPKDVIQVNNELWVMDQNADSIFRFDTAGNYVATIDGTVAMLDNIRGACFANNTVYVTNDGTSNGATADSVVMFDTAGNRTGQFIAGPSPFDVFEYNGELLVADFSDDTIGRYDYMGNFLGNFHDSDGTTGIDNIEQLNMTAAGTIIAAGFSSPSGIYEYDSMGNEINYYSAGGLRGVLELGNGEILFTESGGLKSYDTGVGMETLIQPGNFQFANLVTVTLGGGNSVCNGDGGDQAGCTDCPCGNNAPMGTVGGCLNSAGTSTQLTASGDPSVSLPSGSTTDLQFSATGAPPGSTNVLLSGNAVAPASMANPCFGLNSGILSADRDGLRCVVQVVVRHGNRAANGMGEIMDSSGPSRVWGGPAQPVDGIAVQGGFVSGQTRFFQITHRDDAMAVCMRGLNTSQAVSVTFTP